MKVYELIEKLQQMDQYASVEIYAGYDSVFGDQTTPNFEVKQDATGWCRMNDEVINTVFIL